MSLLRGCMKFNAWQPPIVEVDGQLGQGAIPRGQVGSGIVVPSAGVSNSEGPNLCVIMYHSWCIRS
jgi:hypothetical protein